MATLPQTNPAGGPNPNSPPPGSFGVSVADLPQFAATGNARAAMANLYAQRQAAALAPDPAPAPSLPPPPPPQQGPSLDPTANLPAMRTAPAPAAGPDPTLTPMGNLAHNVGQYLGGNTPPQLASEAARQADPGVGGAIYNWMFNPVGSPEAQAYHDRVAAAGTLASAPARQYMSDYPSLIDHATTDPVGFARQLGPILEAHAKEMAGTHTPMPVTVQTADGPQVHQSPNGEKTTAISKALNLPLDRAHIISNPGMYSTQDFTNAMRGTSRGALKTMWEMQHYLNPQQQAEAQYLSGANASNNPSYLDSVLRTITLGQNATLAAAKPGTEPAK